MHHQATRPEISHPQVTAPEAAKPHEETHEAKHPEQHGQITATPKGWQRTQQAQPHPEARKEEPKPQADDRHKE